MSNIKIPKPAERVKKPKIKEDKENQIEEESTS